MKKILYLLPIIFLFACSTPGKYVNQGKYDQAIEVMVAEMQKQPSNMKKAGEIGTVYRMANQRDTSLIVELKSSGKPDIWYDVYRIYRKMDQRYQTVKSLPDTTLKLIQFQQVNYQPLLDESRIKACTYLYAVAEKQLKSGKPGDVQSAYRSLIIVNELMPGFKDVQVLLAGFKEVKTVNVFYKVNNEYPGYLPYELEEELEYLDLSELNTPGYRFYKSGRHADNIRYDISIEIHDVKISPEDTREQYYAETAKVQDGIGYRLDEEGNFVYDSLGRKIEYPLLKTIACYVTETTQSKSMLVGGTVEIRDAQSGAMIDKKSISGETKFFHRSARFKGDLNALSPETFQLVGSKEMDYPTDLEMILRASDKFKINTINFILSSLDKLEEGLTKNE